MFVIGILSCSNSAASVTTAGASWSSNQHKPLTGEALKWVEFSAFFHVASEQSFGLSRPHLRCCRLANVKYSAADSNSELVNVFGKTVCSWLVEWRFPVGTGSARWYAL